MTEQGRRRLEFTLARPLKLLNITNRMHWRARSQYQRQLAQEIITLTQGRRPAIAFARARVEVVRWSSGSAPDHDNLTAALKALLDCLVSPGLPYWQKGKLVFKHPHGLGIIADDSPECLEVSIVHAKATKRLTQRTTVSIIDISTLNGGLSAEIVCKYCKN
jgi:hypothetical protein